MAGQNVELSQRNLQFEVAGRQGGVAALLLDDQHRAPSPDHFVSTLHVVRPAGVTLAHTGAIDIRIDALDRDIAHVLCVATDQATQSALICRLTGENDSISFTINPPEIHSALVCFELYRRDGRWKVRAVGQGYAGGVTELLGAHHLTIAPSPTAAMSAPIQLLGDCDPLERITMIHEDAARVTAALLAAGGFAEARRDNEMSAAVADPATRTGPAAQHAIATAQQRHDDLMARAHADYHRDAAHLVAELAALDDELPQALASWEAPTWQRAVRMPSNGIRLGTVTVRDAGSLTVPFCVPAPLRRPIWLDTQESSAAAPVAASVLLRLLAAAPHPTPTLDIIDIAGSLRPLWRPLAAHMPRSVVTEPSEVVSRLRHLVNQVDLAALRRQTDNTVPPAGVVLIADFGYAMSAQAFNDVLTLINTADDANLSLVFTGDPHWENAAPTPVLRDIADHCLHMPVDTHSHALLDPWTHNEWQFTACTIGIDHRLNEISAVLAEQFR